MRIQHNIMAMSAYRNYTNNVSAMKKNLEKLSSGYKINRAGDDAAGLAISEKMRAQITGLETAQKNAKDGISLVQTAEGALTEVHDMLNRMVELASMSANGTYDSTTDRKQLQKEMDQLTSEINRIADSSNFNGIKLLNGEMNSKGYVYGTGSTSELQHFGIPDTGSILGTDTVLHAEASTDTTGTEFSVELHNITFDNRTEGNKLDIAIGGGKLTLEVLQGGTSEKMTASEIVAAIKGGTNANYKVSFTPAGGTASDLVAADGLKVQFKGSQTGATAQDFTLDGTGTKLTFKQDKAPTGAAQVVTGDMTVRVTASVKPAATVGGKSDKAISIVDNAVDGTADDDAAITGVTNAKFDATNLDTDAIAAAAAKVTGIATGDVKLGHNGDKLTLVVGDKVVGESDAITWADLAGVTGAAPTKTVTFKDADGKALGSIEITGSDTAGQDIGAATFDTALDTGLDFTAKPATATKTLDATTLTTDAAKAAIIKAAKAANATSGDITISYNAAGATNKKLELKVGNTVIGYADEAAPTSLAFKDADGNAIATVAAAGTPVIGDYKTTLKTGLTYTAPGAAETPTVVDYNVSTTDIKNVAVGQNERLASTRATITADMVKEGSSIIIGKTTYTFKVDADSSLTASTGVKIVDVSDLKTTGNDYLSDVLTRLTDAAADNTTYTVGHDNAGATFTVTEKVGQTDYVDKNNKSSLTSKQAIAETLGYKGLDVDPTRGTGLILQIGDTAEQFNQLQVDIQDMHAASLGLDKIKISDQKSAADAIDVIKDAINTVSDVRGTLGATQNRLDHTINNLSVMTENIQDAESTIRDVDVAEEMMAYTKNNILIQSAQAMLAQANQVPQGVLQLLQ